MIARKGGIFVNLEAELVLEISVNCGEILTIGDTPKGFLRVIPIIGGSFSGAGIKGEVIPGGADWNTKMSGLVTHVLAKYTLKTDDGVFISIENEGFLDIERPETYIRTVPKFQVLSGSKYDWLRSGVFVGSLRRKECEEYVMEIKIYKLK
jgi:Protein of unknown function (DUF3237).